MKAGKQAGRQTGRQCRSFHIATIYASPCPPPSPGPCCRGPHGSFIRAPHPQSRYPQNHKQRFRPKTGLLAQGHTAGKTPSHCTWRLTSVRKPPLPPLALTSGTPFLCCCCSCHFTRPAPSSPIAMATLPWTHPQASPSPLLSAVTAPLVFLGGGPFLPSFTEFIIYWVICRIPCTVLSVGDTPKYKIHINPQLHRAYVSVGNKDEKNQVRKYRILHNRARDRQSRDGKGRRVRGSLSEGVTYEHSLK